MKRSSAHEDSKEATKPRAPPEQVVHYTKGGIPFVYELEEEDTGPEVSTTTYQNPAFRSTHSIDWGT